MGRFPSSKRPGSRAGLMLLGGWLAVAVVSLAAARWSMPHLSGTARAHEASGATAMGVPGSALEAAPADTARSSRTVYLDHDVLIVRGRAASESGKRLGAPADPNDGKGRPEFELIVEGTLRLGGDPRDHVTYPPAGEDGGEWSGVILEGDGGS
jgi:hypothetical protein